MTVSILAWSTRKGADRCSSSTLAEGRVIVGAGPSAAPDDDQGGCALCHSLPALPEMRAECSIFAHRGKTETTGNNEARLVTRKTTTQGIPRDRPGSRRKQSISASRSFRLFVRSLQATAAPFREAMC